MPPHRPYPGRSCRVCGRYVYLNRSGEYRRHFTEIDGRRHRCPGTHMDALTEEEREQAAHGASTWGTPSGEKSLEPPTSTTALGTHGEPALDCHPVRADRALG